MTKVEAKLLFDLNELGIDGSDRFIERAKDVLLGGNEESLNEALESDEYNSGYVFPIIFESDDSSLAEPFGYIKENADKIKSLLTEFGEDGLGVKLDLMYVNYIEQGEEFCSSEDTYLPSSYLKMLGEIGIDISLCITNLDCAL